jgi:hypothetical protein
VVVQGTTTLNGTPYDSFSFPYGAGSGTYLATFLVVFGSPLPSANFTYVFQLVVTAGGTSYWATTITFTCSGGSLSTGISNGLSTRTFDGPPIPAGFVLKTITCDVAVFDAPGGRPVGSNAIKGGQNLVYQPNPGKNDEGTLWTEIFVAGYHNGFVPTSCVH